MLTRIYFAFSLVVTLISICQSHENCSQFLSRHARRILNEMVVPMFQSWKEPFSDSCQLDVKKDYYQNYESGSKFQTSERHWECRLCGKEFYSENYLDQHLKRKHIELVNNNPTAFCLANLCPILRCDIWYPDRVGISGRYWDKALCKESSFVDLRKQCLKFVADCSVQHEDLRSWLETDLCGKLTCSQYWRRPKHLIPMPVSYYVVRVLIVIFVVVVVVVFLFLRYLRMDEKNWSAGTTHKRSKLSKLENFPQFNYNESCSSQSESDSGDVSDVHPSISPSYHSRNWSSISRRQRMNIQHT